MRAGTSDPPSGDDEGREPPRFDEPFDGTAATGGMFGSSGAGAFGGGGFAGVPVGGTGASGFDLPIAGQGPTAGFDSR